MEAMNSLNNVESDAVSYDSYHFSVLYTKFDHEEIIEWLGWLVDVFFRSSKRGFERFRVMTRCG